MMKYQKVSTRKGKGKRSASIPFDLHHIIQPSMHWNKIESGCHSYPVFAQEPTRIKHMIIQWSNTEALGMYAHLANHRCTVWHSESFCAIWILQVFDVGEWKRHNSYRIERSRNPGGFVWDRVQDPDSFPPKVTWLQTPNPWTSWPWYPIQSCVLPPWALHVVINRLASIAYAPHIGFPGPGIHVTQRFQNWRNYGELTSAVICQSNSKQVKKQSSR